MAVNPARVSEISFINLAIPGLMTLLAAVGIARFLGLRPQGQSTHDTTTRALFVFWIAGYILWLTQSSVYRFAVILEMLAPLLITALLARWVSADLLRARILLVVIPLMLANRPANFGRFAYAGATCSHPIQAPGHDRLALAPLSYMVPAFPEGPPSPHPSNCTASPNAQRPRHRSAPPPKAHHGPVPTLLPNRMSLAQPMLDHLRLSWTDYLPGGDGCWEGVGDRMIELCPCGEVRGGPLHAETQNEGYPPRNQR